MVRVRSQSAIYHAQIAGNAGMPCHASPYCPS